MNILRVELKDMEDRTFKQVVKGIKRSEKDVDKVLKAAKLQRTEKSCDYEGLFDMIMLVGFYGFGIVPLLIAGLAR